MSVDKVALKMKVYIMTLLMFMSVHVGKYTISLWLPYGCKSEKCTNGTMSYWETIEHENKASIKACNILCNGDKLPQKSCQKWQKHLMS